MSRRLCTVLHLEGFQHTDTLHSTIETLKNVREKIEVTRKSGKEKVEVR